MSVKTKVAEMLSARFKFKSPNEVELVIIDARTNEIFTIFWAFREQTTPTVVVKQEEVDNDK